MPPTVQDHEQDESNPHDVLLPSIPAQFQREHVIDGNAVAQGRMHPTSGEGNTISGLQHHYLVGYRAWLGAQAAIKKAALKLANPTRGA